MSPGDWAEPCWISLFSTFAVPWWSTLVPWLFTCSTYMYTHHRVQRIKQQSNTNGLVDERCAIMVQWVYITT